MFDLVQTLKDFYTLPQPVNYHQWLKVTDEVTVHTLGRVPQALRDRRPGEPDDVFDYRTSILKPITKGSINKGFDNLYRIFHNTSWSWVASKALNTYLIDTSFDNQLDFKEYTEKQCLRVDIEDPNGLLCWYPLYDVDTGEFNGLEPRLYPSRKIRWCTKDAILILDEQVGAASHELLDKGFSPSKIYNKGKRYILISTSGIWTIEVPTGQQNDLIVTPIMEMEFTDLPVVVLGGNKSSAGFYESFFGGFIPYGDEALMCFSDHQAVNVQFSYPVREEKAQKCTAQGCRNGRVPPGTGVLINGVWSCDVCKGSGYMRARSPWGVFITKEDSILSDEKGASIPAVQFHSPDSAILSYSSEEWRKFRNDAEQAIHLVYIQQAQSGDAKVEDQRGLYALLQNIGDNYFGNIVLNSLWIMEQMINSGSVMPIVYKPVKYQVTDDQDPVTQITTMIASGAPKHLITVAVEEFLRYQYNESNPIHKITAVLIQFDPYFAYTPAEREREMALGIIDVNDCKRSALAYPILRQLSIQLGDEFIHTPIDVLLNKLEVLMKPLLIPIPQPKQLTAPNGTPA